jgi:hypothetical protein
MATTKQPTLASLKKSLAEEKVHNEKLAKDLASANSTKEHFYKAKQEAEKEVESIHTLLDVLPGALARKTIPDPEVHWNIITHSLMTRFAAYLANGRGN